MIFEKSSLFSVLLVCSILPSLILASTLCHYCNSNQYPKQNCLNVIQNQQFARCVSEFNQCYTILVDNFIQRGCVSKHDQYFPNQESIKECKNPDECEICTDSNFCNAKPIIDTCIKCTSYDGDTSCTTKTEAAACSLKRNFTESDGCYLQIDGAKYTRGCMRNLVSSERKLCQEQNANCQSCKYPNCNLKERFGDQCYECNGEKDAECAHTKRVSHTVECKNYTKTCATGIDPNGFTHRGCYSYDVLNSLFPLGYEVCPKLLCNSEIFPSYRPKCHQCENDQECVTLSHNNLAICNVYPDQCFAYMDNNGTFYRGCMKENSKGRRLCEEDAAKCEVCDEDKCNSQEKWEMNASQRLSSNSFYFSSSTLFALTYLSFGIFLI